jgi:hypothetical protein
MPKFYQKIYNTQITFGSLCFIILFLLSLTNISLGNSWLSDDKPTIPLKRISKEKKIKTSVSSLERNNAPDAFIFTVNASKDTVSIGETVEIKIRVSWVDYAGTAVHFLPEWYKYALKVVMPKGFIQTGGDYEDYCTKPVNELHPEAVFTIKGHFEYKSESTSFRILRGFEGANANSEFIFKQDFNLNVAQIDGKNSQKSSRIIEVNCAENVDENYHPQDGSYFYWFFKDGSIAPVISSIKKDNNFWYINFIVRNTTCKYVASGQGWQSKIVNFSSPYTYLNAGVGYLPPFSGTVYENVPEKIEPQGETKIYTIKITSDELFRQINNNLELYLGYVFDPENRASTGAYKIDYSTNNPKSYIGGFSNSLAISKKIESAQLINIQPNSNNTATATLHSTGCAFTTRWGYVDENDKIQIRDNIKDIIVTIKESQSISVSCILGENQVLHQISIGINLDKCTTAPTINSGGKNNVCINESITLSCFNNCPNNQRIKWDDSYYGNTYTITPTNVGVITVTARCEGSSLECVGANSRVTINVLPKPSTTPQFDNLIGNGVDNICGSTINIRAKGCDIYYWKFNNYNNGNNTETYTSSEITLPVPARGLLSVYCGSETCYNSSGISKEINYQKLSTPPILATVDNINNFWTQNGTRTIVLSSSVCPNNISPELFKNGEKQIQKSSDYTIVNSTYRWTFTSSSDVGSYYVKCSCLQSEPVKLINSNECPNIKEPTFKKTNGELITSDISDFSGNQVLVSVGCESGTLSWNNNEPLKDQGGNYIIKVPSEYFLSCFENSCILSRTLKALSKDCSAPKPTFSYSPSSQVTSGTTVRITGNCSSGTFKWDSGQTNASRDEIITLSNSTFKASCSYSSECKNEAIASINIGCNATPPTFEYSPNNFPLQDGTVFTVKGVCSAGNTFSWDDGSLDNYKSFKVVSSTRLTGKCTSQSITGCYQAAYLDIPVNQRIAMSLKLERQNAICGNGKCDGKILATITNRENKYTYTYWFYKFDGTNWQPQTFKTVSGNIYNSGVSDQGNSIDIRELSSGKYKVAVRDYQYGADDPRDGIEETIEIAAVACPSSANFSISATSNCLVANGSVAIVVNGCQNGTIDWWRDSNAYGGGWIANPFNPNNVTVAGRYKAVCSTAECPKERNDYAFSNAIEIIAPDKTKPILLAANNKTLLTVPELTYNLCTVNAFGVIRVCQERSIYYQYDSFGQLRGINDARVLLGQGIGYFASSDANLTMPAASRLTFVLGESVTLMANGCPNGTYRWSNGETGSTITLQPTANTPIYVQCYSGESCTSQISNTIFLEKTSGNFEVSSAAAAVCSGAASTVLTAKGCENNLTVRWFRVGEANTIGSGKTLSVTPTQSTEYYARCYEATKQLLESNKIKVVAGSALGVTGLVYNKQSIDLVTNSTTIRPCTNAEVVLEAKGCEGVVRWATLISNKGSGYTFPPSEGGVVYNTFGNETDYADIQGKSGYSTLITKFTTNQVIYVGCGVKNASSTGYQCTQWKAINVQLKGKSQSILNNDEFQLCEGRPLNISVALRDSTDTGYSLQKIDKFGNAFEYDYRPKKVQSGSNTQDLPLTSPFSFEQLQVEQTGKWRLDIKNECGVSSRNIDIYVISPPIDVKFNYSLLVKKLTLTNNSSLAFKKLYRQDRFVIPSVDEQRNYYSGEPGEQSYRTEFIDTYAYWTIKKIESNGSETTVINRQQQTRLKSDTNWGSLVFDLPELGKYKVTVEIRDINTLCVASYTQVIEAKCQAPAIPIKPANADKFSCIGTNTVTFSATGCNQAGQVLKWYQYDPQASNVNTLLTSTGNTLSISTMGMAIGTYMYRSKCVQESCESDFSEKYNLTIGANTTPVANAIDPKTGIASQTLVTAIQNRKVALSMTGCEYGNVNWYRQGNANILASGNTISVDYATVGNVANQEFAFYGQCVSGVAPNTCTSANSNLIKVKFIACPAVANITMTPNATSVCGSVVLGASGGDNVYVWKNATTGITLSSGDAFKVENSGGFYYESCGNRSNTVNIVVNQVKAEVDGPVITGNAIGVRELLGGTTPTYQWRNTAETTGTVLGTASSYTPTQAGNLFVWVTKGSCTTGPLQSQAYAQGANCNIDFATGTQGVAVSCDGGMATLTLKHNLTTVPAGAVIEYRLDLGAWSTDAVISGVPYGKHTVSLRYTNGTQICYATRKLDETAFDACGKLACDDLYITATDSQGLETYTIPRDPATKGVKSLVLKVASFSGDPLNGLTYQWERVSLSPNAPAFTSTQASISIAMPGTYKVTLARGTSTCSTLITIGASPCNTIADPATRTCTTSALTGVADEAANRLTDLAAGDVVQAGDFNITITEVTGTSSGWNGKGYVTVPYLNAQVNVVLKSAVFNDCYQLTNANSSSEQPTVFTEYDPNWGNVSDIDNLLANFKSSLQEMIEVLNNFSGKCDDVRALDKAVRDYEQAFSQSNDIYSEAERTAMLAKINDLKTKRDQLISCADCTISGARIVQSSDGSSDCGAKAILCRDALKEMLMEIKKPNTHPILADVAAQLAQNPAYIRSLELFDDNTRLWHYAKNENLKNNIKKPTYFPANVGKLTDYLQKLDDRKKRVLKDIAGIGADNQATLADYAKLKQAYEDWPDRYDVYYVGTEGATCSFFVGECLFKSGLLPYQTKYLSALELRNSSLFKHLDKSEVQKGDIVSFNFDGGVYHVEIITSVSSDRKSFCSRGAGRGAGLFDRLFRRQLDGVEKCDTIYPFDNVREFDNNYKLQFLRLKR